MTPNRSLANIGLLRACAILAIAAAPVLQTEPTRAQESEGLKIQRLSWAGIKFELDNTTLLIDPIITDIWEGANPQPIVPIEITTRRRYVLITHPHNDHYDRSAIAEALGERGRVICHSSVATYIASDGFKVTPVELYEPVSLGGFTVMAVPAVDGFGDDQVSWVVTGGGKRFIHCGDTVWHGAWWKIAKHYGPFDAAFMPINGFTPGWVDPRSDIPASLTPEQAVAAAVVLGAKSVTPIHFGFTDEGMYEEYPDALNTFLSTAKMRDIRVQLVDPGDWLDLDS